MAAKNKLSFLKTASDYALNPTIDEKNFIGKIIKLAERPHLLVGSSHAGKTTLATQLIADVAMGADFLGMPTSQSDVLFYQRERNWKKVFRQLHKLGWDEEKHAHIAVLDGNEDTMTFENLNKILLAHHYPLVVVETLSRFMRFADGNDNTAAVRAFAAFEKQVFLHHCHKTAFILMAQYNKSRVKGHGQRDSRPAIERVSGATEIVANSDSILFLERVSDQDPRRIFFTLGRDDSEEMPLHYLRFDPATRRSYLDIPVALEYKRDYEETRSRVSEDIKTYVRNHPGCVKDECLKFVHGHTDTVKKTFDKLVIDGLLIPKGKGVKGDPHRFWIGNEDIDLKAQFGIIQGGKQ